MTESILVANRGEIACRIINACKLLGYRTVAVYSDADREAVHAKTADVAAYIGPAPATESYLNARSILSAARATHATAIHPGYGFLSENPEFARAVGNEGLTWIGPSPECLANMGDKDRARKIAASVGIPIVRGSDRFERGTDDDILTAASKVGYPVLIKAAAGGGGIGMQLVRGPEQLIQITRATQSMAKKAFGISDIYLEHYVEKARHIEVQIFGFGDGTSVHLYERDCSVQRRFQKIIEEAIAPNLNFETRCELYKAATTLANSQKYAGAGTVEFIYDKATKEFWFLEMNTRIQVEHAVTEAIAGVDLVEWQIEHAFGNMLKPKQTSITINGHALECRIYAERPERGFLPSPGRIVKLNWPQSENGSIRIDTGVRSGDDVTSFYDPLIAKLIVHGSDRTDTIKQMQDALRDTEIDGLRTNIEFLKRVLANSDYQAGIIDTQIVSRIMKGINN